MALLTMTACSGASTVTPSTTLAKATSYAAYDQQFADWAGRYVECARLFGAAAEIDAQQGSIRQPYAPGRPSDQGLDADCVREVGYPPKTPELTVPFLRGLYALLVQQADCLAEQGYVISDPPSRDDWVENYSGSSWNPLIDVDRAGQDVQRADALCPQPEGRDAERLGLQEK